MLEIDRLTPATASTTGENRGAGEYLGLYAHLRELGIGGRWLGAAARRRPAAGGEVVRWGSVPVLLDDGGEVGELPGGVLELRPGSAGTREGRKVESHSGLVTAVTRKLGELVGEPM
jgi:hypothetical protein